MFSLTARNVTYVGKDFSERRDHASAGIQKPSEDSVLNEWQQRDLAEATKEEIQKLLHAAIGSEGARAPGVTDRLLQLFMKIYRVQKDKSDILHLICTDFGFVSEPLQHVASHCPTSAWFDQKQTSKLHLSTACKADHD